jgi:hypothetical protein
MASLTMVGGGADGIGWCWCPMPDNVTLLVLLVLRLIVARSSVGVESVPWSSRNVRQRFPSWWYSVFLPADES